MTDSDWTVHACGEHKMRTSYGKWYLDSDPRYVDITFCLHCGIRLPTRDPALKVKTISTATFKIEDLVSLGRMPRHPWNEGRPISATEVEGLRIEFQDYIDVATKGDALGLAAWGYLGGLKTLRSMDESYCDDTPETEV